MLCAQAIQAQFPGYPPAEARAIAEHAGRQFDPISVKLAIVAHVPHVHTGYADPLIPVSRIA
jgi:hypothetical protein